MTNQVPEPGILSSTKLPPERYLELIESGSARLAEMGRLGLEAEVPSCPGWTVADVLAHVAQVYQHKVACMRENTNPDPWPPPEFTEREPLEFFEASTRRLIEELRDRGPLQPSFTWWADHDTAHPVDATVRVRAGGRFWLVAVGPDSVTVTDESYDGLDRPEPVADLSGEPASVLLWLWGRQDNDAVSFDGDAAVLAELRARLAEAT